MVKVGLTRGQLLNVTLMGVQLVIPPADLTLFDTEWIVKGVGGLFMPSEDIWKLGDANRDHVVNEEDKKIVEDAFGSRPGDDHWNPDADFNEDGLVDMRDLAVVIDNMGLDRRGGTVGVWIEQIVNTALNGIINPIASGVWSLLENVLSGWVEDYYARKEES